MKPTYDLNDQRRWQSAYCDSMIIYAQLLFECSGMYDTALSDIIGYVHQCWVQSCWVNYKHEYFRPIPRVCDAGIDHLHAAKQNGRCFGKWWDILIIHVITSGVHLRYYTSLIDVLGANCKCPYFGIIFGRPNVCLLVHYHRQNTLEYLYIYYCVGIDLLLVRLVCHVRPWSVSVPSSPCSVITRRNWRTLRYWCIGQGLITIQLSHYI